MEEKKHGIYKMRSDGLCIFSSFHPIDSVILVGLKERTQLQCKFFSDLFKLILYAAWSHFRACMTMAASCSISDRYFNPWPIHGLFLTAATGGFHICIPFPPTDMTLRIPSLELLQVSLETQKTETPPPPAIIGCFGGDKPVSVGCLNGSCTYRCISALTRLQNQPITFYIMYIMYVYTVYDLQLLVNACSMQPSNIIHCFSKAFKRHSKYILDV